MKRTTLLRIGIAAAALALLPAAYIGLGKVREAGAAWLFGRRLRIF